MKKIILMLTAALTFTVASAQECKKDGECCKKDSNEVCCNEINERPKRVDMMAKNLGLTEEQKAKVEELNKKYGMEEQRMPGMHRGQQGMRRGPQGERKDNQRVHKLPQGKSKGVKNRQEMMENMKKYNEELKEILTPEQQEKYDNMRKARMQGQRGMRR